jgi:mRNA interferase MazF
MGVTIDLDKTQRYLDWIKKMLYLDTIADNAKRRSVKRGQVYKCNLGIGIGSEEGKERPCVILQGNLGNLKSSNTIVAPITHTSSRLPIVVPITAKVDDNSRLILDGNVLLGNIITISKARIGDYVCDLTLDEMKKVDISIAISTDIKRHYDKLNSIYKDKLVYIGKLIAKNDKCKDELLVLHEVKELLHVANTEDLIEKIKKILD